MYIGTCVPWMAIEAKFSKLFISGNLEKYKNSELCSTCL